MDDACRFNIHAPRNCCIAAVFCGVLHEDDDVAGEPGENVWMGGKDMGDEAIEDDVDAGDRLDISVER